MLLSGESATLSSEHLRRLRWKLNTDHLIDKVRATGTGYARRILGLIILLSIVSTVSMRLGQAHAGLQDQSPDEQKNADYSHDQNAVDE